MNSYRWRAVYEDGTIVDQFDADGNEISSSSLDAKKVTRMDIIPQIPGRQPISLLVDLEQGERFIRFWRNYKTSDGQGWTVTVIGLQKTVDGNNVKFFVYLNPDGTIEVTTDQDHDYDPR